MRLIDADELMEHAWRDKLDSRELIAEMIANAPTIKEIPTKIPIDIFEKMVSQEPIYYPPCIDCNKKMDEIRRTYDNNPTKTVYREYNDIYDHYLCGNCRTIVMDYDNYCPNCGYRMIKPQEKSDKE